VGTVLDTGPPGLIELGREIEELRAALGESQKQSAGVRRPSRRMREVTALYAFTDKLNRSDALADVYEAALEAIVSGLGCDRASILVFDEHGVMRFVAWRGLSGSYRHAVDGHSPWRADTSNPQPIAVNDILASDEREDLKFVVVQEGIRGLAFIPLVAGGKLIGKFMTYYNLPHEFDADEINLASTIASQVAFGIDRKRAQDSEKTLIRELQHRTSNLLAVVQAIAHQSLWGSRTLEEAREVFEGRLQSLARANRQLANSNWTGLKLGDLVRQELEPFGGRVQVQGPEVILSPQQAQNVSMAIHELATNATKYGALSMSEGYVKVWWDTDGGQPSLKFSWQEVDGPPVKGPERHGFGTSLLKSIFSQADITYAPSGFCCELVIPLEAHETPT
jgi:two-component sensor histidine kinase